MEFTYNFSRKVYLSAVSICLIFQKTKSSYFIREIRCIPLFVWTVNFADQVMQMPITHLDERIQKQDVVFSLLPNLISFEGFDDARALSFMWFPCRLQDRDANPIFTLLGFMRFNQGPPKINLMPSFCAIKHIELTKGNSPACGYAFRQ